MPVLEKYTDEQSEAVMRTSDEEILADLEKNGEFYRAFNEWLEASRAATRARTNRTLSKP